MNDFNQNMMRFDAYLNNEMSKEQRILLEEDLKSDLEFAQEFEEHKKFLTEFNEGVEYRETKKNLKSIHKSIYDPDENFFFNRKFYVPLAIAASVVFILLIFNPAIKDGASASTEAENKDDELAYTEKMDSISPAENSYSPSVTEILDTILADQTFEAESELIEQLPDIAAGTAFMISKDGYFLTAKNLVEGKKVVRLQQKEENLTFEVNVIYIDPVEDFAILKCQEKIALNFKGIPYRFINDQPHIKQEVFALGYPKRDLLYSEGSINTQNGYFADSLILEKSIPSSPGYNGAPLFTYNGDLIGIISSNKSGTKSVTYFVNHHYIQDVLETLKDNDGMFVNMSQNYTIRPENHNDFIKWYAPYIFELHP